MNQITLCDDPKGKNVVKAEIDLEKRKEIVNYLKNFLMDNDIKVKDRKAIIIAFDQLKPIDLTDAFFCANIVYCQHIISELNQYRKKYKLFEQSSQKSSNRYRWAIKEYSNLVGTLNKLISNRQNYNLEKNR